MEDAALHACVRPHGASRLLEPLSAIGNHDVGRGYARHERRPRPVSYTHLDVYKRQGQSISLQVLRERYRAKLILPVDLENCIPSTGKQISGCSPSASSGSGVWALGAKPSLVLDPAGEVLRKRRIVSVAQPVALGGCGVGVDDLLR